MSIFKFLVALAIVAVIVLVSIGAIYVTHNGDQVNITIDKSKIRHATDEAVEHGKEALRKTEEAIDRERHDLKHSDGQ